MDGPTAGEAERMGFDVFVGIDDDLTEVFGRFVENPGPTLTMLHVQAGGEFVAG